MSRELSPKVLAFASRMRELRKEKGLTKAALSEALDLSLVSISEYEKARIPTLDNLEKIKKFYDVSYEYLFDETNIKKLDKVNISISKETGLSETSINYLKNLDSTKDKHLLALINDFIENLDRYNIK